MPITISDAPGTLPKAAKKIYVGAFNGAYSGTCKKRSDRDACASMIAWGAVKNKYKKSGDKWVSKALFAEVELIITKATLQPDGSMRWQAVASDTDADRTGDSTSLQLFNDWIQRAETGKSEPWLPEPRLPFLGVSHYPSLDGLGEAGMTERMFIDGNRFKADGPFSDNPLGKALFAAIRDERETIKKGEQIPVRAIRISAAWWDIQHSHGDFTFTRRSLADVCPFCLRGAGDKIFLQGQLDHYASTRVPVNPRTTLELEEKSMKVKRQDDAASIVGDDLAEELEKQAQELVGKSEADAEAALVIKAEEKALGDEGAEGEAGVEKHYVDVPELYRPYGGATSIQEAEEFIQAIRVEDQIWNNWDVFSCVAGNIMSSTDEDLDKLVAMRAAVDEFSGRVATIKSSAVDAFLVRSTIGGVTMKKDPKVEKVEPEVVNDPVLAFKAAVDAALANTAAGRETMIGVVQTAIDGYVAAVKAQIDAVIPPPPGEELAEVVKALLQPLAERLDLLTAKLGQQATQAAAVPVQKSMTVMPGSAPADLQKPPSIRDTIRRSVGLHQ